MVVVKENATPASQLALEFTNTVDWHASAHPEEGLTDYPRLVAWAKMKGALTEAQAKRLLQEAAKRPAEAQAVVQEAIRLREAVYHILVGRTQGRAPQADDLSVLNQALQSMLAHAKLVAAPAQGFAWGWQDGEGRLDIMLWPVARSAAELLTSPQLERVGLCADERGCGWLFLDTSKNRTRRWCDMGDCGNRAKARRHYQKQKGCCEE